MVFITSISEAGRSAQESGSIRTDGSFGLSWNVVGDLAVWSLARFGWLYRRNGVSGYGLQPSGNDRDPTLPGRFQQPVLCVDRPVAFGSCIACEFQYCRLDRDRRNPGQGPDRLAGNKIAGFSSADRDHQWVGTGADR